MSSMFQAIIAILILVGATVLAGMGLVDGTEALAIYGVLLGYAFGVTQGVVVERRNGNNGKKS